MPVVKLDGSLDDQVVLPETTPDQTIAITNEDEQLVKISQYIGGERWTGDYYLSALASGDEVDIFDPGAEPSVYQYYKIKNLVIFQETPLEMADAVNLTGSGYISAGIIPNVGDMFVANVNNSRKGIFTVTEIEKRTYNLNSIYLISYKLHIFADSDPDFITSMDNCVVKNYFYNRDHILTNSSPIVLEENWYNVLKLKKDKQRIINAFFDIATDTDTNYLVVPGQAEVTIDPMISEFIHTVLSVRDHKTLNRISNITINHDSYDQPNIWRALLEQDGDIISTMVQEYDVVYRSSMLDYGLLASAYYQNINRIVYPKNYDPNIVENDAPAGGLVLQYIENPFRVNKPEVDNLIPTFDVENTYYVLTENFYTKNTGTMTQLEALIWDYLDGKEIDASAMKDFVDDFLHWGRIEQFYYIPLLLILISYIEENNYTT